jgi:DNA-binding HxlR family transcriptional regulator
MSASELSARDIPPCGCSSPGTAAAATCYCGVDDLLQIIRRRYSLAAMNAIRARGSARYHDLAAALSQASSSTIAETLRALEAARLISRRDLSDRGPHTEYSLTASGDKLLSRLRSLLDEVQSQ